MEEKDLIDTKLVLIRWGDDVVSSMSYLVIGMRKLKVYFINLYLFHQTYQMSYFDRNIWTCI